MDLYSHGYKLDLSTEKFGELRESNDIMHDGAAIRSRIEQDGYLLLRGLIDRERVLEARREILLKFAIVGEIDAVNHPLMHAVQSDDSMIDKVNLMAFTESIRTGQAFTGIGQTPELIEVLERYFGEPARSFDFRWSRFVRPGETTGFHSDSPYVNRGSQLVTSAWIPLGDVTREEGALLVLENSHKNLLVKERYSDRDSDRDGLGWLSTNPISLQKNLGGRWLSTDFMAGDVLIFTMYLVHGALDNNSPENRCRLTSDFRFQPASHPVDERWNGAELNPHGGRRVFLPGLGKWNNRNFQDEWKEVDAQGRLKIN